MVLFGKGGGRENFLMGPRQFSPGPTQNLSLQNGEKTKWGEFDGEMTKLPMCTTQGQKVQLPFFFFPFLFFSYDFPCNVASFFLIFFSFDFLGVVLCFCFCFFSNGFLGTLASTFFFFIIFFILIS